MRRTPWPIELGTHPLGSAKKERSANAGHDEPEEKITDAPEAIEARTPEETAAECFKRPETYRKMILDQVRVDRDEDYDGGSVHYLWLNKICPVGCEFCFFKSPTKAEQRSETEITDDGINKLIQFTEDGKIDKFVVSGGGEPMMSRKKVYEMARRMNVDSFVVVTSAYWSRSKEKTDEVLRELLKSAETNPHGPTVTVRLSLDEFHFCRLERGKGFLYVQNLLDWFAEHAKDNPKFRFLIHTMEGDKTVEDFLNQAAVKSRVEKGKPLNRKTQVTMENGLVFEVEYSQIFDSNPDVDLRDENQQVKNSETFKDFLEKRRNGNMSLSFHGDQPKGVYYLTLYDGTNIIWGATSPDVETSIYEDGYKATMEKNLGDVITLGALDKGPIHMQDLVAEVNPKAVARAVGVGLRDFYPRLLLEEDTTRLYVSVRLIQEYLAEGRIPASQFDSWPKELKELVKLDAKKLKSICLENGRNIVSQYLDDPALTAEKLEGLFNRVRLGHYSITTEQMLEQIAASGIDPHMKEEFERIIDEKKSIIQTTT